MRILINKLEEIPYNIFPDKSRLRSDIEFISCNEDNCDLFLVFDTINNVPKTVMRPDGCSWLLAYEPPVDIYAYLKDGYKNFDLVQSEWTDIDESLMDRVVREKYPLFWGVEKTFAELESISINDHTQKQDRVSGIISSANTLPGHKIRQKFINYIKDNNFDFDHFGVGYNFIPDKFDGIFPYKYSIAMENSCHHNYCTEKIVDCYVSLTMPIYWGCPNITDYFPAESMILINKDDLPGSLDIIKEAIRTDLWRKNLDAIIHARDLILNKYSLYPYICNMVDKYYAPKDKTYKETTYIPITPPKKRKISYKIKKVLGIYRLKDKIRYRKWYKSKP